jgi:hypothetical protein
VDENVERPHLNQYKTAVVVLTHHLSYAGDIGRRITSEANPGQNARPYLKNN